MINSIKNGDQPLPRVTQVSIAGTTSTEQPPLKDKSMWSDQQKRVQKIDCLERSFLIQGLPNDIYSLIDSNKTAKDLSDALARHILGSEYGQQDRKAAVLYKAVKLASLHQNQEDVNDAMGSKKKTVVVTSDPLVLIAEKTNVSRSKDKVIVSSYSEGSEADDFNELTKITALLAKTFNRRRFLSKPTNNNLRTSSSSQSANKKQEFVKTDNKRAISSSADEKISEQTSSLKPYVSNVILEKIIIDLEEEVVNLLEKEKANLETIESSKSKGFDSSENVSSESENQSENDCLVVEKECDKEENPKSSCDSNNVEIKLKRKRHTFSSVRRPKNSGVIWKKKGSSNTFNVGLSVVSVSYLNKNVKRYSRKDLLACNNSHLGETRSAFVCNDAMNVSCDSRMNDLLDDNNFFIFDDVNVRIYPVSKMPFRKKPRDFMNVRSKSNSNKYLPRTVHMMFKDMTGNRALLTNFVEKFLRMIHSGNNDFAMIAGYGDVVIGLITIK
nr:hypothetical protein [Tanacetum cinerariifolium]